MKPSPLVLGFLIGSKGPLPKTLDEATLNYDKNCQYIWDWEDVRKKINTITVMNMETCKETYPASLQNDCHG